MNSAGVSDFGCYSPCSFV